SMSADGRYVAFISRSTNLVVGGTHGWAHVFVHDRQSGATELVSVSSAGEQGDLDSDFPAISAEGRYGAFQSFADNLVPADTNGFMDVFVFDRQTRLTERVSVTPSGEANSMSVTPALSGDGRFVAFSSRADNLVSGDVNGTWDVFVHDRANGTIELVS